MKNKYIRKLLCLTLISGMVVSTSFRALASEMGSTSEDATEDAGVLEVPEMPEEPVVTPDIPDVPDVPDTPEPTEPLITPEPTVEPTIAPPETEDPTPTETPTATPTDTPTRIPGRTISAGFPSRTERRTPGDEGRQKDNNNPIAASEVMAAIEAIGTVSLDSEGAILSARSAYESLSDEQKALVSNYGLLAAAESALNQLKEQAQQAGINNALSENALGENTQNQDLQVNEGPITRISSGTYVVNLKAGRSFYLKQLKSNYSLAFNEKFEEVMDEIEEEFIKANKLDEDDEYLVHNWQDILAVYVMQQERDGKKSFKLNKASKDDLAAIFAELNAVERDKKNIALVNYKDMHVEDYIKAHKKELTREEIATLRKYADQDCALLCATITAAKGFIRQSAGEEVSEERVAVIQAGYSLVGKVAYFWGGKSSVLGWDDRWGSAAKVSSAGSSSTGRVRAYGLDCSGFVDWAFNNGYQDTTMEDRVGHGTSDQWNRADTIAARDAQAGDLVFQRGPEAGSDNHVGILVGKSSSGDWIAVHCSGSQNGVTVGEAYSASFRYIRRPTVFPTEGRAEGEKNKKTAELLAAANKKNVLQQAAERENPNKMVQVN